MGKKIDFFIVGAQKSGTTTVFNWLQGHPDIFLPDAKEILFFSKNEFYSEGEKYLNTFYAYVRGQKRIGLADVNALYFPYCARRIFKYNRKAKIIALLRNPVDRAYSAYWFARRNGLEPYSTFEDALKQEDQRKRGQFVQQSALTYLEHGKYNTQMKAYIDLFGRQNVFVATFDKLLSETSNVLGQLFDFLDVSASYKPDMSASSNRSSVARIPSVQRFFWDADRWYRKLYRICLPTKYRYVVYKKFVKKIVAWNIKPFYYPPMQACTREWLKNYFAANIHQLITLCDLEEASAWIES